MSKMIINIVGPKKSGTTLLGALFDMHPQISSFPLEIKFITHLSKYSKKRLSSYEFKKEFLEQSKIKFLSNPIKYNDYRNRFNIGFFKKPKNFNYDLFSKIFLRKKISGIEDFIVKIHESLDLSLKIKPRKLILIQDGNHFLQNKNLMNISIKNLKKTKFIFIYRNPIDIYVTYKNYNKHLKLWKNNIFNFENYLPLRHFFMLIKYKKNKLKNCYFVNYEDFVKEPENHLKNLCNFLEIKFNRKLLKPTILNSKWFGNSTSRRMYKTINKEKTNLFKKKNNYIETLFIYLKFEKIINFLYPNILIKKRKIIFVKLLYRSLIDLSVNSPKNLKIFFKYLIFIKNIPKYYNSFRKII